MNDIWRIRLILPERISAAMLNLSLCFVLTLFIGDKINDKSTETFFHYFVYGEDRTFGFDFWFIQPLILASFAIYVALMLRALLSKRTT